MALVPDTEKTFTRMVDKMLHEKIAKALGWSLSDVKSFSLQSLRDLVRPVDSALAEEITKAIQNGVVLWDKSSI